MAQASTHHYIIALGSNRRHRILGDPVRVLDAAIQALAANGLDVIAVSPTISSRPIGPSQRNYANGAARVETALAPDRLLALLKQIERHFGQRRGQRWSARVLDLDIILWSGGWWQSAKPQLIIPHIAYRQRAFVLGPMRDIAPDMRDPATGHSINQLFHQLNRPKRLDQQPPAP